MILAEIRTDSTCAQEIGQVKEPRPEENRERSHVSYETPRS